MLTERYQSGISLGFIAPDNKNLSVEFFDFLEQKGLINKNLFTDDELKIAKTIEDEMEENIYDFSVLLENYCQDIIDGTYFDKRREAGEKANIRA